MPKVTNADVSARFKRYLFPSNATYYDEPLPLESGSGTRVRDFDGKEYLDFFGGILTVGVGHGHPAVNAAVMAQVNRLGHVSTLYPTLAVADLAERLVNLAPGKMERAFFCTSGTEADETAVALAQVHTGRQEIVALRHGYSGRSLLGQSLTAHAKYRVVPTQAAAVKHAHAPYCYRCPFGLEYPSCEVKCARDIEELIQTTTVGEVAGFIAEPILGVGGVIEPPAGWLKVAVDIVKRYGGIFLCDEVQTGFGRTGSMWGVDPDRVTDGVTPDVVTMAKGIANGYPISAVVTTSAIAGAWRGGNISTFGGNPISCAAASATVDVIEAEGLVANAAAMGAVLKEGLVALAQRHPIIGDVRGRGLMLGMELVRDEPAGDRTPEVEATLRILEETRKRGLLIGRGGLYGNVLRVAPALIVTRREIDDALTTLQASFEAVGT
ncbi:MAG TPA: aspartate aminotransferase family protein [Polyangiaceae bacterium]|jgi:4-aminobutyrate aminotransferase-like enzyme|nr:aspartate aminotransferase family protein [Polyangiaceae bacterium]